MSEPVFVSALGWALVDFLWQGLAVGSATAVALALLRNARPQSRYAVACAALALCAALPVFGLIRGLQDDASVAMPFAAAVSAAPTTIAADVFAAPLDSWRSSLQLRLPWIVALWSLGAALLALRMALGMAWVSRLRRAAAADARWQARLDRLASAIGLRRRVPLRIAEDIDSPVATGWWRPMVLMPAALIARMPADLLEALLAHELAHIKRYDYLVNLVQSAIEALLFYHPVVWWLSKRIRAERERIADELAAQALGDPKRLALALQQLDLIRAKDGFAQPHLAPAAHGGNLMSRIQHLVRPDRHALSWKIALPILGLSAICLTVFAQGQAPSAKAAASSDAKPQAAAVAQAKAAPAAKPAPSQGVRTAGKIQVGGNGPREAYALVRAGKDSMTVSGNVNDIREAEKARRSIQGDFLWFRRGKESYVLQDAATLARIEEAWKPTEVMGAKMDALGDKMSEHGKTMEGLSRQMEALSEQHREPDREMERTSQKMEGLAQQQQALSERMQKLSMDMARADSDREREALDAKMRALDTQMQPLSRQMQAVSEQMNSHAARMQESHKPMEALSQRMNEASKPMEALSKQMDVLAKQQEQLSREADRVVRVLIEDAMDSGKALPMSKLN